MDEIRRKRRPAREYYPSGALRSLYLEEPEEIELPGTAGKLFPGGRALAELITFYESGAVKRIFPLYGQLSAFWTEEDEFGLLEKPVLISIPGNGLCPAYPEDIFFYESGALGAVTIWKRTSLTLQTARYGPIRTHFGADFYESGALKSIEPAFGTRIGTGGREVMVFDPDVWRLHAENNSLRFDEAGRITAFRAFDSAAPKGEQNGTYTGGTAAQSSVFRRVQV